MKMVLVALLHFFLLSISHNTLWCLIEDALLVFGTTWIFNSTYLLLSTREYVAYRQFEVIKVGSNKKHNIPIYDEF